MDRGYLIYNSTEKTKLDLWIFGSAQKRAELATQGKIKHLVVLVKKICITK